LGYQIVLITLLGTAFLGGAAFGLYRLFPVFDVSWRYRLSGVALFVLCAPVGAGLYFLAASGDLCDVLRDCATG
jgi:hypothetical protein